jgi:hypothetical protein
MPSYRREWNVRRHSVNRKRDDDPVQMYRCVASRFAMRWHQKFKFEFIATMARSGGDIPAGQVRSWIAEHRTVLSNER